MFFFSFLFTLENDRIRDGEDIRGVQEDFWFFQRNGEGGKLAVGYIYSIYTVLLLNSRVITY